MKKIKIGNRTIGEGQPVFITAEAGVNHNGKIDLAYKLIDAAVEAGCDAVKFQTFITEREISKHAEKAEYQKETTGKGESQMEMVKKLELPQEDFKKLQDYATKKGIMFYSAAFDFESVDTLDALNVPCYKIGSGEINNYPFLRYIAKKGRPIIFATGTSNIGEIEAALKVFHEEGIHDILVYHCITRYPAPVETANLRAINTIRTAFQEVTGLSDHTTGITVPIAATALGIHAIEKHFTLDNNMEGPDHKASLNPTDLKKMVKAIRDVESAMGTGKIERTKEEIEVAKVARKSIVADTNIVKGTIITEKMITYKRPGTGIEPKYLNFVIGKKAKQDIPEDTLLAFSDLE
ncbi:MAG: N-acetylneuraminate synthase [Nanoarchaeota archaeon]